MTIASNTKPVTKPVPKPAPKNWLGENWLRVVVHIGVWGPLVWLVWRYFNHDLGVDPVVTIQNITGRTAMILLLLCLAATPLYIVFNFRPGIKVRRALGLYAFMYASFHFVNFIGLDYGFDLNFILSDGIQKKPYILVGLAAILILLALALTSSKWSMKVLKKNWSKLHWMIYPAGILVIIHFLWRAKAAAVFEPYVYASILTVLLLVRVPPIRKRIVEWRTRLTGGKTPTKQPVVKPERVPVANAVPPRKEIS